MLRKVYSDMRMNFTLVLTFSVFNVGIGAGVESMTTDNIVPGVGKVNPKVCQTYSLD